MIKPLPHDDAILLEEILDRSSTAQIVDELATICAPSRPIGKTTQLPPGGTLGASNFPEFLNL